MTKNWWEILDNPSIELYGLELSLNHKLVYLIHITQCLFFIVDHLRLDTCPTSFNDFTGFDMETNSSSHWATCKVIKQMVKLSTKDLISSLYFTDSQCRGVNTGETWSCQYTWNRILNQIENLSRFLGHRDKVTNAWANFSTEGSPWNLFYSSIKGQILIKDDFLKWWWKPRWWHPE